MNRPTEPQGTGAVPGRSSLPHSSDQVRTVRSRPVPHTSVLNRTDPLRRALRLLDVDLRRSALALLLGVLAL